MKRALLVILSVCLIASLAFAQGSEKLSTTSAAAVSVKRAPAPVETLPEKVHPVLVVARHADGTEFYRELTHNIRTTAGGDWQASVMGNTSAPPATCNYIAVTNDASAPAAGDSSLASEIAANGLSRAIGTYAHTAGTASYTISKTFSASGTQASQKTGLFNASGAGTMCFEASYTAVTVNNGDSLTVTWTINY